MSTLGIIAIVIGCIIAAPFIIGAIAIVGGFICAIICSFIEVIRDIFCL